MARSVGGDRIAVASLVLSPAFIAAAETVDRHGIEGEPIPLDSKDAELSDYLKQVKGLIQKKWAYPCVKDATTGQCEYKSAKLVIVIDITKDGRVSEVEVAERSGYGIYDAYAVNAVKAASPFPPVPVELMAMQKPGSTSIRITTAFRYIVETTPKRGKP